MIPNKNSKGTIDAVSIRYSLDGIKFTCYNDCKDGVVKEGLFRLNPRITASKLRVSPTKWTG